MADDAQDTIRLASLDEIPEGFEKSGSQYKQGHQIWELQAMAEGGFRLIRKKEDRHVDARDRDFHELSASPRTASLQESEFRLGQRVSTIRDGRIANAVILMLNLDQDTADLRYPDGVEEEEVPLEMISDHPAPPMSDCTKPGAPILVQLVSPDDMDDGEDEEHPTDAFEATPA